MSRPVGTCGCTSATAPPHRRSQMRRSPKRIDCYQVAERSAAGAAFKLDPARLVDSLRWKHNASPPDFEMLLIQAEPPGWVNTANLVLLGELRRRAPEAIDWTEMQDIVTASVLTLPHKAG